MPLNKDADPWFWLLYLFCGIAWVGGILTDAKHERVAWVIADILVPPIGMMRGLSNIFP